jgi:hypothetical protein
VVPASDVPPEPVNWLDSGIEPEGWTPALLGALADCRLGDVIVGIELPYLRGGGDGPLWLGGSQLGEGIGYCAPGGGLARHEPLGVITSQTCDLREQDQERRQPWMQVCPAVCYEAPESVPRKAYLYPLTGPDLSQGTWVADLRMEAAVEKTVLCDRQVVRGFQSEDEEVRFALALGRRRDRAALHDLANACLYQPFARMKNNNRHRWATVREEIYRVGLIISGPRLEPVAIQPTFILAHSGPPSTGLQA